ncbi:ABC transporter permease [Thermithiobacillus plumbiphilus]|uniref:FtsX-like permease family protein n=1 Tax=Thermithiobacillus plumbiphilus TaxID=1729899 RepID=A0ABU9D8X0_9PROT
MSSPALSLRLALRQLRSGWRDLLGLVLALAIGVAALVAVSAFTDRVARGLARDAGALLGADLVLSAGRPLAPEFADRARQLGLQSVRTVDFPSMVLVGERDRLTEVKAVSPGFPLRGRLQVRDAAGRALTGIPAPGTVWVEPDLLNQLRLSLGDGIELGDRRMRLAGVIINEPSRGGGIFTLGPRVMLNLQDLASTGLLGFGSRARYRLLLAGPPQALEGFRSFVQPRLERDMRLEDVQSARPELRITLSRAQNFLGLAALTALLLSGIAIATTVRSFVSHRLDAVAILRCLGASTGWILSTFLLQILLLGVLGGLAGVALGYLFQAVLPQLLAGLLEVSLPVPGLRPGLIGLLTGLASVIIFALPPLLRMRRVPALRVLRRDLESSGRLDLPSLVVYSLSATLLAGLVLWQAGDLRLGLYVLAGMLATLLLLAIAGRLLLRLILSLRLLGGIGARFGLANLARPGNQSVAQMLAFGVALLALLSISVVQRDLLAAWSHRVPADAPNRFVINLMPDQVRAFGDYFREHDLPAPKAYPMVRARLIAIDGRPVSQMHFKDQRAEGLAKREFNLSSALRPQADNVITAGRWWGPQDRQRLWLSVEEGLANTLGLRLGDTMTYDVAGQSFTAKVVNLRRVNWDSFHVNFFVVMPPGYLDRMPSTYVSSFYLPPEKENFSAGLVARFPNASVLDVEAIVHQVQDILGRVSQVVGFVFLFSLAAGVVVLFAAIQSSQWQRRRDAALLRTLGAKSAHLRLASFTEFAAIGFASGLIAALGATLLTAILSREVFDLPFSLNPWIWLLGPALGALGIGLMGLWALRRVIATPPLQILR